MVVIAVGFGFDQLTRHVGELNKLLNALRFLAGIGNLGHHTVFAVVNRFALDEEGIVARRFISDNACDFFLRFIGGGVGNVRALNILNGAVQLITERYILVWNTHNVHAAEPRGFQLQLAANHFGVCGEVAIDFPFIIIFNGITPIGIFMEKLRACALLQKDNV